MANIVFGKLLKSGLDTKEESFSLEVESVIVSRMALLGTTGCGKSNTMGVVLEGLANAGYPFVLIDSSGEHGAGLKTKYDVLIASAGESGDITHINVESAETLAQVIVDSEISAIIDLVGFTDSRKREFVTLFINKIFERCDYYWKNGKTRPRLLAIEETHIFAPQMVLKNYRFGFECKDAVENVASQGRKRGLGLLMATQRPAKLNKDVLAMSDLYFLMWASYPNDAKTEEEWIGGKAGLKKYNFPTPTELNVGDAIICGKRDLIGEEPKLIHFYERKTPYGGGTPKDLKPVTPEFKKVMENLKNTMITLAREDKAKKERAEYDASRIKTLEKTNEELKKDNERLKIASKTIREVPVAPLIVAPQINMAEYVPKDQYQKDMDLMEDQIDKLKKEKTPKDVWIDDFGNIHSEWPWLIKLANVSRINALIIKFLIENSDVTTQEISLKYAFNETTIRKHFSELLNRKVIRQLSNRVPFKFTLVNV